MIDPAQHRGDVVHLDPVGQRRPIDHHDGQSQGARGNQLGLRAAAARILAHQQIDTFRLQQRVIGLFCERAAINDEPVVRQRDGVVGVIDEAQQIMMLGLRGEGGDVHPPQRQHDAARRPRQCRNRAGDVGYAVPAVALPGRPTGPRQRDVRNTGLLRSSDGVGAHLRSEGMRRVDQMSDARVAKVGGEPCDASEAADAHRNRLHLGRLHATGIAESRADATFRQRSCEGARFGRTAEDQDVRHG